MKDRIGIVGGGQLARMMTLSAKQMGFTVTVLDPTPDSPAGQVSDKQIIAGLDDEKAMFTLVKDSDFLTLDWELANPDPLEKVQKKGVPVNPSPETLRIIKDKYQQKLFLQKEHIPVADFVEVKTADDIEKVGKKFGYPILLKAKTGGYDGKGNYVIDSKKDIETGLKKLQTTQLYIEKFIPFVKELAIMVARNTKGDITTYPVVETIHKNNILHMTLSPAPIESLFIKKAESLARKTMEYLKGAGVFGIEMFLTKDGQVLINEIAPRVHNSGHYSIEACITSQFEQHIRTITGLPLGKTDMKVPCAVMVNVLGERNGKAQVSGLEKALDIPGISVHIYGKAQTKIDRKMGHITVVGTSLKTSIKLAKKARNYLSI